jgi:hypothetical protein
MNKERMGQIQDVFLVDELDNNIGSNSYPLGVKLGDSSSIDAFSRLRVSNTRTIFDTKLNHTEEREFWDMQEVSGAGTTSVHNPNRSSVLMSVADSTAGKLVRQTFARPNYQPGKSQFVLMTGILGDGQIGITREIGQADDENGMFFRNKDGLIYIGMRSFVTGSAVDTVVVQTDWNVDKMDGTGPSNTNPSGQLADFTNTQIFMIDYQWLGVGRIRFAINIEGIICIVHEMFHANTFDSVYISTPNNPLRYSIENDGTGPAANIEAMCSAVISEGGQESAGVDYYYSTNGTHIDANSANTIYAVIGLRLKDGHKGEPAHVQNVELLTESNDNYEWMVYRNPTIAGTFTYSDGGIGPFDVARGVTGNTVSGAEAIAGGWGAKGLSASSEIDHESGFGESITGIKDEYVLCVRPLTSNADIQGSITAHVNH